MIELSKVNVKAAQQQLIDYLNWRRSLEPEAYLLQLVAYQVAPILEGVKPGVTITFAAESSGRDYHCWHAHQKLLPRNRCLNYYQLYEDSKRVTVLFFNERLLEQILADKECVTFLEASGYDEELTVERALLELKTRCQQHNFPHELGIFLGIPLVDVIGFMKDGGKGAIGRGYWRVYDSPEEKAALFACYQSARFRLVQYVMAGNKVEEYLGIN